MKKDKEKVLDEVWTEDHVRSFLDVRPHDGSDENFHMLLKAYQSMRASDFELFVKFFGEQGRNLGAQGPDGRTVLEIVSEHRHGSDYAQVLRVERDAIQSPPQGRGPQSPQVRLTSLSLGQQGRGSFFVPSYDLRQFVLDVSNQLLPLKHLHHQYVLASQTCVCLWKKNCLSQ